MTSAQNCLILLDLLISSIPLLPFRIRGLVAPQRRDTKHSQKASAVYFMRQDISPQMIVVKNCGILGGKVVNFFLNKLTHIFKKKNFSILRKKWWRCLSLGRGPTGFGIACLPFPGDVKLTPKCWKYIRPLILLRQGNSCTCTKYIFSKANIVAIKTLPDNFGSYSNFQLFFDSNCSRTPTNHILKEQNRPLRARTGISHLHLSKAQKTKYLTITYS